MKPILFLALFLFVQFSICQTKKGIIHFKDGTSLEGLAKLKGTTGGVKFRKNKKGKSKTYKSDQIKGITYFQYAKGPTEYEYKIIKGKSKKPRLLEVVIKGEVSLYKTEIDTPTGASNPNGMMKTQIVTTHFLCRNDSEIVEKFIKSDEMLMVNFKKTASNYFKDCPSLVDKLKNKIFKKRDIEEVVTYYNTNCN